MNGFIGCKDEISALESRFIEPYLDTYKTASSSYLPRSLCPPPAPAAGPLRVSWEPEVRCFLTIFSPLWNISRRVSSRVSRGGASLLCPQLTALHKEEDRQESSTRGHSPPDPESQSIRVQIMSWVTPTPAREHGVGKDVMLHCYIHRLIWNSCKKTHKYTFLRLCWG